MYWLYAAVSTSTLTISVTHFSFRNFPSSSNWGGSFSFCPFKIPSFLASGPCLFWFMSSHWRHLAGVFWGGMMGSTVFESLYVWDGCLLSPHTWPLDEYKSVGWKPVSILGFWKHFSTVSPPSVDAEKSDAPPVTHSVAVRQSWGERGETFLTHCSGTWGSLPWFVLQMSSPLFISSRNVFSALM